MHEIVSISPHNLVYAILICPMLWHESCLRKLARAVSLLFYLLSLSFLCCKRPSIDEFKCIPLIHCVIKNSPRFLLFWHKIYHRHCESQCGVAILRTMCSYKRYNDYAISHLQNWYAHVSLSVLILLSFCNNFLFLPLCDSTKLSLYANDEVIQKKPWRKKFNQ